MSLRLLFDECLWPGLVRQAVEAEQGELTRRQQLELMPHGLEVPAELPDLINQVLELRLNADGSIESGLYEHPTALRPRTPEDGLQ